MQSLTKPRAILFDWDNTLVDTWPTIHEALNMTLRHMNHPQWSFERVKSEVKKSMRDSFPAMFGDAWEEAASHYQTSYRSLHLQSLQPLAGAKAMLESIPRSRVFVGIVSNKRGDTLRQELTHLGWAEHFASTVGAGDAAYDKPNPAPVMLALDGSGINPAANVWFVGDTGVDLECAQATGCTPILFGDHAVSGSTHEGFFFAAHARDHSEMAALIERSLMA
jgi:phosphoglycolate phosphatase